MGTFRMPAANTSLAANGPAGRPSAEEGERADEGAVFTEGAAGSPRLRCRGGQDCGPARGSSEASGTAASPGGRLDGRPECSRGYWTARLLGLTLSVATG